MWFKKKAYISGYNSNTAVDNTDWRTNGNNNSWFVSQTLPSAADANNYFYLPALGCYGFGQLDYVGSLGYYWASSADPWNSILAFYLKISSGTVTVSNSNRTNGFRAEAFQ